MYKLFSTVLFICVLTTLPSCTIAKYAANSQLSTNVNSFLLKCASNINKNRSCEPQLIININFTPNLNVDIMDTLLILDETYEPTERRHSKIMSPYIIVVSRTEPLFMYPLLPSNWKNVNNQSNSLSGTIKNNYYKLYTHSHITKRNKNSVESKTTYFPLYSCSNNLENNVPIIWEKCGRTNKIRNENVYYMGNSRNHRNEHNFQKRKTFFNSPYRGYNENDNNTETETREPSTYTVYNLSVPFPYLSAKIRVFRKRRNTWWRVTPSVILNNLLGTFVTGNLSILLKSYEDILQKRRILFLKSYRILIPTDLCSHFKDLDALQLNKKISLNDFTNNLRIKKNGETEKLFFKPKGQNYVNRNTTDLKYALSSANILSKCPNNNKLWCLNVVDDRVPAFSIKIKMPFRQNVAHDNIFKVKISRIITDATTKDALQIYVDVINKGPEEQEFSISISNCPLSEDRSTKTIVKKMLLPDISETITFLLPFIMGSKKNLRFHCDVIAKPNILNTLKEIQSNKSTKNLIISRRSFEIETHSRCFCIWNCNCHCIGKLETQIDMRVCRKMSSTSQKFAGLIQKCPANEGSNEFCSMDLSNEDINHEETIMLLIKRVVFPLISLVIIILLVFCCCKCFKPRKEDLIVSSTEWFCYPDKKCNSPLKYDSNPRTSPSLYDMDAFSQNFKMNMDALIVEDVFVDPALKLECKTEHQMDLLELALLKLTKQQSELQKK